MEDPSSKQHDLEAEEEELTCTIKEVEVTVPKTDDPSLPVMTFRMWVLGIASCVLLSFVNQFMWYRDNPMSITSISAQIAVVPLGHLMAKTLPNRVFFQGSKWEFTLNPGPFNVKEHVIITIFANAGAGSVYAVHILSSIKLYYKRTLTFIPAAIIMLTTQTLGYGWAGLLRRFLVEPPEMWWPSNLVQVSLFRALHEKEKRAKGSMNKTQFFLIVLIVIGAYTIIPGYLMTSIATISWLCWINPNSVLINQLGSGKAGLGILSFGIDWSTISSFLGSPLVSPWFATANILVGFSVFLYVITPIVYWTNTYNAKSFPIFSKDTFMSNGSLYDTNNIINSNFNLDVDAYQRTGPLNLSILFTMTYGMGFATLSATIVHVALFNGRDIWRQARGAFGKNRKGDIHTQLMKVYSPVPMWWFLSLLALTLALILFAVEHYKDQLQLPWWGVLLACALALTFSLPIGIITATTNQQPGLNIITEYIIGYLYPGRPVANMCFKVYGYISMVQGLSFVQDFKLGHYMKIPPRAMFTAQVVGTVIAVAVYTGTAWWLMEAIPHLCDTSMLPSDSMWTCPNDNTFYTASIIWGLVGPRRIFGDLGHYSKVNWFFLGGAIGPVLVWIAAKMFPNKKWIRAIHLPVLIGATSMMPPAAAVNFNSWILVGFLMGFVAYRYRPSWWERYNYLLSGGLDAGCAFVNILIFFSFGYSKYVELDWLGGHGDRFYCPLAKCPTAKGVVIDGCPVF